VRGRVIDVYALRVSVVLDRWREDRIRTRRWVSFAAASACLRPEFRPFVAALGRQLDEDGENPVTLSVRSTDRSGRPRRFRGEIDSLQD
jgi:hypothetical protein